jgi:hypothetical protein
MPPLYLGKQVFESQDGAAKGKLPTYCYCPNCNSQDTYTDGDRLFCGECENAWARNIDLCPNCGSTNKRCGTSTSARGVKTYKFCEDCNHKYTSHNCIRIPYIWLCFMRNKHSKSCDRKIIQQNVDTSRTLLSPKQMADRKT